MKKAQYYGNRYDRFAKQFVRFLNEVDRRKEADKKAGKEGSK